MGHTLVTAFSDEGYLTIEELLHQAGAEKPCKIPYGRECERNSADRILRHHITLFHWSKADDAYDLNALKPYHFQTPCRVSVSGAELMHGAENSLVLSLRVQPEEGFAQMKDSLEQMLHAKIISSLHITLAVSQNHDEIQKLYTSLCAMDVFPFALEIIGADLYHIWKPVKLMAQYRP